MLGPNPPIIQSTATGPEIEVIVDRVDEVTAGFPRAHVVMALIAMTLCHMNPNLSAEQVVEGVKEVSGFICTYLPPPGVEGRDVELAN